MPLRGELSRAIVSPFAQQTTTTVEQNLEKIQQVLSRFVQLSRPSHNTPSIPQITISSPTPNTPLLNDSTAPWSWTAGEAATTESVLFPFLIHLAAARNDTDSITYCIDNSRGAIGGGVVNYLEPGSGKSPLHIAALNGYVDCVDILLRSGALVHLRDALGHTALYYVRICGS